MHGSIRKRHHPGLGVSLEPDRGWPPAVEALSKAYQGGA
jgi:hypothetical protein